MAMIVVEPGQILDPEEDVSRLARNPEPWRNLRYIYEPLAELITADHFAPYCWGAGLVSFYSPQDHAHRHRLAHTSHAWRSGDVVESDGQPFSLLSARCVFVHGQWAMRWLAGGVGREGHLAAPEKTLDGS